MVPPWRYLDGSSGGFAPINNPPEALPDSLITDVLVNDNIPIDNIPIKIVSYSFTNVNARQTEFTGKELTIAYIDIRKMLTIVTIICLVVVIGLFAFDDQTALSDKEISVLARKKCGPNGRSG